MIISLEAASLTTVILIMVGSAAVIGYAGVKLAGIADTLADRTGMGEILAGAVFVGFSTSLPGIITSVTTAAEGYPQLAIGNALGGLTVQTCFLAIADLVYRRANLEHAAASVTGLAQATLLVTLLTLPLLAEAAPELSLFAIHPVTPLMFLGYGLGLRLLAQVKDEPMWEPIATSETQDEEQQAADAPDDGRSTGRLWVQFAIHAVAIAAAGFLVAESAGALVDKTVLSESAVGTLFAAVATSLPELITAVAAIRRGALNLAVGDVIGGNAFDVLFLSSADIAWRGGSIYHQFEPVNTFTALMAILMTGVLLLGMLRRERHGVGGIGFESALVLVLYGVSVLLLLQ